MKSFAQYLMEAPIGDGEDFSKYSETPKDEEGNYIEEYSAEYFKNMFQKDFKTVGNGSSRIALQCDVPVHLFSDAHKEMITIGDGEITQTVLKLASNEKGVQQNTVEVQMWDEVKYEDCAQFLCPILDWSGNPRYSNHSQYVLDINNYNTDINCIGDLKGAFWVQMPLARPANRNIVEFFDIFNKTFGPIDFDGTFTGVDPKTNKPFTLDHKADLYSLQNLVCFIKPKEYAFWVNHIVDQREKMYEAGTLSDEQFEALYTLVDMVNHYGMDDLANESNWGILDGRPVIIDYGYDKPTNKIYHRPDDVIFQVYVDASGSVRIKYKEKPKEKILRKRR